MKVDVNCYAGYRAEESPRSFLLGGRRIEIIKILDRWRTPDSRYFKVRGNDGNTYTLTNDDGGWDLEA